MLAPKIENKTQNARTCKIEPKKCEKRKHTNPCQKPSTLTHFQFSLGKKRFLVKKNHNKKNFVILVKRRAFPRERKKEKKNSLEKCCKLFMRAQNSLMLLPNSRNACHMHAQAGSTGDKIHLRLICCTKKASSSPYWNHV
jgi:hypothetical protein